MERERCLLVGIELYEGPNSKYNIESDMVELAELVKAAEGIAVSHIIQKRDQINNKFYIGKGKLEEIAIYIEELDIATVVINGELSGSQIKNIEDVLNIKVIDRTMLILDIFARRALTKEGKLQVELAQLKYRLPRLKGIGLSLSRQGGGIGSKGPGETKMEIDRRHIVRKINEIERQLQKVEKVRDTKRKQRLKDRVPLVSIVGYTNAGKSTLLNTLLETVDNNLDKKVFSHDMLFATLDTELRRIKLPGGREAIFSDTVGFVKNLPTQLIDAFKGTLEEIKYADIILHVMDINDDDLQIHKETTLEIIKSIVENDIPIIETYNKIDKSEESYSNELDNSNSIYISAKNNYNINYMLDMIDNKLYGNKIKCTMQIPNNSLHIYYKLLNAREIEETKHENEYIEIIVTIYDSEVKDYKKYILEADKIE